MRASLGQIITKNITIEFKLNMKWLKFSEIICENIDDS